MTYSTEQYDLTFGVKNIFDRKPVFLDFDGQGNAIINNAGVPLGVGYDMLGRSLFAVVNARF